MTELCDNKLTTISAIELQVYLESGDLDFISDEEQYLFDKLLSKGLTIDEAIVVIKHNNNSVVKGILLSLLLNVRRIS